MIYVYVVTYLMPLMFVANLWVVRSQHPNKYWAIGMTQKPFPCPHETQTDCPCIGMKYQHKPLTVTFRESHVVAGTKAFLSAVCVSSWLPFELQWVVLNDERREQRWALNIPFYFHLYSQGQVCLQTGSCGLAFFDIQIDPMSATGAFSPFLSLSVWAFPILELSCSFPHFHSPYCIRDSRAI